MVNRWIRTGRQDALALLAKRRRLQEFDLARTHSVIRLQLRSIKQQVQFSLRQLLGHSSMEMVNRYVNQDISDIREQYRSS